MSNSIIPSGNRILADADIAVTKIQANAAASLEAGIAVSVFGIQLSAQLEKADAEIRVLVSPAASNPVQSVSLGAICKEASVSDSMKVSVNAVLKYLGFDGGVEETFIDVNQAFYYYSSYADDQDTSVTPPLNYEYAFSLAVKNVSPQQPENVPFQVKSISFALWNSKREKVVDAMGMKSIADALAAFS
jgi:hypothetical protein